MLKKLIDSSYSELNLKSKTLIFLSFIVLGTIYYGNTINNGFNLDDNYIYTKNALVNDGLRDVKSIFLSNSFDYGSSQFGYRPIALLSFALENEFFGLNPKAAHLINLSLYIIVCYLVFVLLALLFNKQKIALPLLVALIYFIMPIHSEAVNNIKCRDELLMFVFGILGAIYWVKSKRSIWFGVVGLCFVILSIFSKKSGLVFLGVLPLISFYNSNGNWKKLFSSTFLMLIPIFLFRLMTKKVKTSGSLREYSFTENPLFQPDQMEINRIVMAAESSWFYFKTMLFPTELISYYGYQSIQFENYTLTTFLGILIIVIVLAISLNGFLKQRVYGLGGLICLGGMLPFINLFKPMVGIVAERFMTISSLGLVIAIVFIANDFLRTKKHYKLFLIGVLLYAIIYLPFIRNRGSDWKNIYTLSSTDVKKLPNSVILNYLYGNSLLNDKISEQKNPKDQKLILDKALSAFDKAISVWPTKVVLSDRATLFFKGYNQAQKAIEGYNQALKIDPEFEPSIKNLGILYSEQGHKETSIKYFKQLLAINPKHLVYESLMQQLVELNKFTEAEDYNDLFLRTYSDEIQYTLNKANILFVKKDYRNSLKYYKMYLKSNPANSSVRQNIRFIEQVIEKKKTL